MDSAKNKRAHILNLWRRALTKNKKHLANSSFGGKTSEAVAPEAFRSSLTSQVAVSETEADDAFVLHIHSSPEIPSQPERVPELNEDAKVMLSNCGLLAFWARLGVTLG